VFIFLGLGAIQLAFLLAPSSTIIHFIPWSAPLIAQIFAAFDVAATPELVGLGIKAMLVAPLVSIHIMEVFTHLYPLFRRYNTTSSTVRMAYVRVFVAEGAVWCLVSVLMLCVSLSEQIVATVVGGFPVWRRLRLVGEREEQALEEKKGKSH
jgi:hypothetical protein